MKTRCSAWLFLAVFIAASALPVSAERRSSTVTLEGISWDFKGEPLPETYWTPWLPVVQQVVRYKLGIRLSSGTINLRCPMKVTLAYDTGELKAGETLQLNVKAEPSPSTSYSFASSFGVYLPSKLQAGFVGVSGLPDILPWFDLPWDFWDLVGFIPEVGDSIASLKSNIGVNTSSKEALPFGAAKEYHDERTLASVDLSDLVTDAVKEKAATKILSSLPASSRLVLVNGIKAAKGLNDAGADMYIRELIGSGLEKIASLASLATIADPYYKVEGVKMTVLLRYAVPGKLSGTYPVNLSPGKTDETLKIPLPHFISPGDQLSVFIDSLTYEFKVWQGLTAKLGVSLATFDLANTLRIVDYDQASREVKESEFALRLPLSESDKPMLGASVNPACTAAAVTFASPRVALRGSVTALENGTPVASASEAGFTQSHYMLVAGLSPQKTYQFAVSAVDSSGARFEVPALTATTKKSCEPPVQDAVIGERRMSNLSAVAGVDSIAFSWDTNVKASTVVFLSVSPEYGTQLAAIKKTGGVAVGNIGSVPGTYVVETGHAITVTGLQPGTTYYWVARSYVWPDDDPTKNLTAALGMSGQSATLPAPFPTVRVKVHSGGSPVAGATIFAQKQGGGSPAPSTSGPDGFTPAITLERSSAYTILFKGNEGFAEASTTLSTGAAGGALADVALTLSRRASPGGDVLDASGKPLAGASVKVVGTTRTAMTDAAGHYTFEGLAQRGPIAVEASRSGFFSQQGPGSVNAYGMFRASPVFLRSSQAGLAVTVKDAKNAPVAQATVAVKEKGSPLGAALKTDAAGKASFAWSFADQAAHELAVEVLPTGSVLLPQTEVVSVSAGQLAGVTITCLGRLAAPEPAAAAAPAALPSASTPPTSAVQFGVAQLRSGQTVRFPSVFAAVPVVVSSAQAGGKACASAPVNITKEGFTILLTSDAGAAVSGAWVQWIAVLPAPAAGIQAGVLQAANGARVSFPRMAGVPVIVTSAQNGKALFAGAMNNAADSFTASLTNDAGAAVGSAWLMWLAVVPSAANGFQGAVEQRKNGDGVRTASSFAASPAYVLSAQPGVAAAAVGNRADGFQLSLVTHQGAPASGAWTQWLGYAGR